MAATAVVVDLDGTVWNTYPLYAKALARLRDVPVEQTEKALRQGRNIVHLIDQAGLSRQRFANTCAEMATSDVIYAGVIESLERLEKRSIPLGIVTSLPNAIAGPLLNALDLQDFFVERVFAARKPQPTGIYTVLGIAKVEANSNAFYVGDRSSDAEMAQRAGVSFAWASYGYGEEEPGYMTVRLDNGHGLAAL